MKKTFLSLLLLVIAATMSAQSLLLGDTDQNGKLEIADVTKSVNMILGREAQGSIALNPYSVDNSLVAGTWYAPDGTSFTLEADGTTTYPGGATFKYIPFQGLLIVYKANGTPLKALSLCEVTSEYLLTIDYATGVFTRYLSTGPFVLVTSISLSDTSLRLEIDSYKKLRATVLPENASNTGVAWSSSNEDVATVSNSGMVEATGKGNCTITCAASDASGIEAECIVSVFIKSVTDITLSSSTINLMDLCNNHQLTATVTPADADNPDVTWTSSDESVATVDQTGLVTGIADGMCTITASATDGSGVFATCTVNVDFQEYVDLDLPSGTLWAACNIGADNPEDKGDYIAWGETSGYKDGKTKFAYSTYKYCKGSQTTLTKYCNNSSYGNNGFTDTLTELLPEDDAATANWGTNWRMPSKEQFDELINSNYTTTTWATQNSKQGYRITSKSNGNSLFLPTAGYRSDSSITRENSEGWYWSRTLCTNFPVEAYCLRLDSSNIRTNVYYREYGLSVRPVRASNN